MNRSSAAVVALAVWVGTSLPTSWWMAAPGILLLAVISIGRGQRPTPEQTSLPRLAVGAFAMVLVGSGVAGGRVSMRDDGALAHHVGAGHVPMVLTVVTEPRTGSFDHWMIVRVERLGELAVRERALLRLSHRPPIGARLRLHGRVHALEPGGFSDHVRGLGAGWEVAAVGDAVLVRRPGSVLKVTTHVRERLHTSAWRALPPDQASILTGLVTGDPRGRPAEVDDLLERAGLRHLVVVSGRHTALFLAGIIGLAMAFRASFRTTRLLSLAALGWFVVLVRWQPSVLRAATVAGIVLCGDLLGRDRDGVHLLAVAVTLLLLVDPLLARQLGFVLSVTATAGVVLVGPWLRERLAGPRWLRVAMAAAVGAQLAVAPVLLAGGHRVPIAGIVANVIAAPAAAAAQMVGSVAAVVALFSPSAASVVASLAAMPLRVLLWTARTAGVMPSLAEVSSVPALLGIVGVGIVFLTGAVSLAGRRRLTLAAAVVVAVVVVAQAVVGPLGMRRDVATLTVTVLDVGQGDSILIEAPGNDGPARMLVDGGPDPGGVVRELARRGVRRLDAVVLTHPHSDHGRGLPAVFARMATGALLIGPGTATATESGTGGETGTGVAAVAAARGHGVPVIEVSQGTRFAVGTAPVTVLHPPTHVEGWSANDRSLVLRVDGAYGDVLLTGDIEESAQRRLLSNPEQIDVDVLKVPHHGGATNAEGFLSASTPEVAVLSVGRDNDYGHPAPRVVADLDAVEVWRTDETGSVRIELRRDGPVVVGTRS